MAPFIFLTAAYVMYQAAVIMLAVYTLTQAALTLFTATAVLSNLLRLL